MSAAVTPARRLLALLEDEPSLETRPRDEIDADLAALGVDPAGPIRLARRIAEQRAGPATALLAAMIEDESAEAEIAALESADIADVRSRLPAGTVAAVTAEAQRRAGKPSNVVGITRPRRRAVWAWTGSLVGMAACALIVVAVWWPPSELSSSPEALEAIVMAPETVERREASSDSASQLADGPASAEIAPQSALGAAPPAAALEPAALESASEPNPMPSQAAARRSGETDLEALRTGEESEAPLSRLAAAPRISRPEMAEALAEPGGPVVEAPVEREPEAPGADNTATAAPAAQVPARLDSSVAIAPPLPPPTPADRLPLADSLAANEAGAVAESFRGGGVDPAPPLRGLTVMAAPLRVVDVMIVEPVSADLGALLMPGIEALFFDDDREDTDTPAGDLSDRMAEARLTADGRPIMALLALQTSGAVFEAVLVRREGSLSAPADDATRALLTRWFGDRAGEFALIALPPRP